MANSPPRVHVVARQDDFVLLKLEGELANRLWTEAVQEHLEDHYVDDGVHRIRVDLSPVSFIDNFGVATLVALYKEARRRGKRFEVEGAQGQVREKLEITGVLGVLEGGGSATSGGGTAV